MDTKNFAIGILSVTAVVLFVGLVLIGYVPEAQGFAQSMSGGDYLVATGQLDRSTELIYIVDAAANRMIGYVFNNNTRRLERVDTVDLDKILQKAPVKDKGRRRRGR